MKVFADYTLPDTALFVTAKEKNEIWCQKIPPGEICLRYFFTTHKNSSEKKPSCITMKI